MIDSLIAKYKRVRSINDLRQVYDGVYAFVGIGSHSTDNLYPVLDYLHVPLKYICCKSPGKIPLVRRKYCHSHATTSINEVLSDSEVKGVFVSTSPDTHFEIAGKVLESGKALFVEKPPCKSAGELKILVDKAKLHGVTVTMAGMQKRHSPLTIELAKRLKKDSAISYNLKYVTGLYPEGDALTDLFIHPLDFVTHLFGKAEITGLDCTTSDGSPTLLLILRHDDIIGVLELSVAYSWTNALETITVNTKHGTYMMNNMEELMFRPKYGSLLGIPMEKILGRYSTEVRICARNNFIPTMDNNNLFTQGYFNEIKAFVDLVEGKRIVNLSPLTDMNETYRLIEAIRRNAHGL